MKRNVLDRMVILQRGLNVAGLRWKQTDKRRKLRVVKVCQCGPLLPTFSLINSAVGHDTKQEFLIFIPLSPPTHSVFLISLESVWIAEHRAWCWLLIDMLLVKIHEIAQRTLLHSEDLSCWKGERKHRKRGEIRQEEQSIFLGGINPLCGVNYQWRQGEVACADEAGDVKSSRRPAACREPAGDYRTSLGDEWHTNRPLNDTQGTQHGQTGREVETLREVSSPRWPQREWVSESEAEDVSKGVCAHSRENEKVNEVIRANGGK